MIFVFVYNGVCIYILFNVIEEWRLYILFDIHENGMLLGQFSLLFNSRLRFFGIILEERQKQNNNSPYNFKNLNSNDE